MLPKTVITALAAAALVIGTALIPTGASARGPGGHVGGWGGGHIGGFGGGHIGGFRGFGHRGFGYGGGIYPGWGYEEYPWPYEYSYGPSCGYVHVKYYRHKRAYWRWVYQCE
ncbi:MAG: hypothetical protein ABSC37_02640 [Xanthobacteraceae bacterium]|jgi:hypothetical protein